MIVKCLGKGCPLTDACKNFYQKQFSATGKVIHEPAWKVASTYDKNKKECVNQNKKLDHLIEN